MSERCQAFDSETPLLGTQPKEIILPSTIAAPCPLMELRPGPPPAQSVGFAGAAVLAHTDFASPQMEEHLAVLIDDFFFFF